MLAVASDGTGEGATAALSATSGRLSTTSRTMLTDDTGSIGLLRSRRRLQGFWRGRVAG